MHFTLPSPSSMIRKTSNLPGNHLERRSFDFFRSRTVFDIAGHFESPLWSKLVLQASHTEPAVQYAAAALGALHEKIEVQKYIRRFGAQKFLVDMDFPIRQYTKSLVSIRDLLNKSDDRSTELVLISSLMCIYYEVLQENHVVALTHLENALKVLNSVERNSKGRLPERAPYRSVNTTRVDDDLIKAFARLDLQASSYLGKRTPTMSALITSADLRLPLKSVRQARELLSGLHSQLKFFMRTTADDYRYRFPDSIPLEIIAEAQHHQLLFQIWSDSFSAFLNHPSTNLTNQEQLGAKVLLVQQNVAYMKACTCIYAEETLFDQFDLRFQTLLSHASALLASHQDTSPARHTLTIDIGIIEPLFWTCIKCRRHSLRHQALSLLRQIPWQEGVWDASIMARIAERFIAIEESILDDCEREDVRVPEWWRAHSVGFDINWGEKTARISRRTRVNGTDGEWWDEEEFISW